MLIKKYVHIRMICIEISYALSSSINVILLIPLRLYVSSKLRPICTGFALYMGIKFTSDITSVI